jgi:hypothetical protein
MHRKRHAIFVFGNPLLCAIRFVLELCNLINFSSFFGFQFLKALMFCHLSLRLVKLEFLCQRFQFLLLRLCHRKWTTFPSQSLGV